MSATLDLECGRLCNALAGASSCDEALHHINHARAALLGPGLLTVNLDATTPHDAPDEVQLMRLWSSDPVAYPVSGRKRKTLTPWTQQLLQRGEVFTAEGGAALAAVFDDHARITALGLQAVINVPLIEANRCVATFNVLSARPQWQAGEAGLVRLLAQLAAPWVLAARRAKGQAEGWL